MKKEEEEQDLKNVEGKPKTAPEYLKELKSQIAIIKPQVELAELKARFAKANFENVYYTMQLHSLQNPQTDDSKQTVQVSKTE